MEVLILWWEMQDANKEGFKAKRQESLSRHIYMIAKEDWVGNGFGDLGGCGAPESTSIQLHDGTYRLYISHSPLYSQFYIENTRHILRVQNIC